MRTCPDCGQAEDRKKDTGGWELVNLDPITGKCVECLIRSVRNGWLTMPNAPEPVDFAKRAAADVDD